MEQKVDIKELQKDLSLAQALDSVSISEGGKILIESLKKDVISCCDTLAGRYTELTQPEFISICADMKSKLDLLRTLLRAPKNKKYLLKVLKEALNEPEDSE